MAGWIQPDGSTINPGQPSSPVTQATTDLAKVEQQVTKQLNQPNLPGLLNLPSSGNFGLVPGSAGR